jgi:hypothetical protein
VYVTPVCLARRKKTGSVVDLCKAEPCLPAVHWALWLRSWVQSPGPVGCSSRLVPHHVSRCTNALGVVCARALHFPKDAAEVSAVLTYVKHGCAVRMLPGNCCLATTCGAAVNLSPCDMCSLHVVPVSGGGDNDLWWISRPFSWFDTWCRADKCDLATLRCDM